MTAPNLINIDKLISSNADRLREMGPSTVGRISMPFARDASTQRTCLHILSAPSDNTSCRGRVEPPEGCTEHRRDQFAVDGPRGSQGSEGEDCGCQSVQCRSTSEQDAVHQKVFDGRDLRSIVVVVLSRPETYPTVNIGTNKQPATTYPSTRFGRQVRPPSVPS